jgi:hypothetical protein
LVVKSFFALDRTLAALATLLVDLDPLFEGGESVALASIIDGTSLIAAKQACGCSP